MSDLREFVEESNRIEGIGHVRNIEIVAHEQLLAADAITVEDLERFVGAVAGPRARLRDTPGMNVRVGQHFPPPGGPGVHRALDVLLEGVNDDSFSSPYRAHVAYERLHPFMDGNGRSGRALWAWMMFRDRRDPFRLGFLHTFYYQALDASREPIHVEVEDAV